VTEVTGQTYSERILRLAYEGASESYGAISGFRARLLALLPLATGAGAFLLLERAENDKVREFLGPIGIFGFVVTLGLFFYEFRGVQRCQRLEVQLCTLEKQFGLSKDQGPFLGQPPRGLGNMLGPPAAGLIVYSATAWTWLGLAGYGFHWLGPTSPVWRWVLFLLSYGVVLIAGWVSLRRWLDSAARGGDPNC
jgi:hypothetical protein